MEVFNIIQERLTRPWIEKGRWSTTGRPTASAIAYLVDNLPADAKILHMLAYFYAETQSFHVQENIRYYGRFPPEFLVLCYVRSMRRMEAFHNFLPRCRDSSQMSAWQMKEYKEQFEWPDFCQWHEHGDDAEEAAVCAAK